MFDKSVEKQRKLFPAFGKLGYFMLAEHLDARHNIFRGERKDFARFILDDRRVGNRTLNCIGARRGLVRSNQ